jgi:hypothetical protein
MSADRARDFCKEGAHPGATQWSRRVETLNQNSKYPHDIGSSNRRAATRTALIACPVHRRRSREAAISEALARWFCRRTGTDLLRVLDCIPIRKEGRHHE